MPSLYKHACPYKMGNCPMLLIHRAEYSKQGSGRFANPWAAESIQRRTLWRALEPCEPGRRLYAGIVSNLF